MSSEPEKASAILFEKGVIYTSEEIVERTRRITAAGGIALVLTGVLTISHVPTLIENLIRPETSEGRGTVNKPAEVQEKQPTVSPSNLSSNTLSPIKP